MNEQHAIHQPRETNVIQFPHSAYDAESDAYSDLGGGLVPYRSPELLPVYRHLSFFDLYEQTPDNAWQTEVTRAYDLSLNDTLQPEHIKQLAKRDAQILATAVYDLYETLSHRAPLLVIDGNYENPSFAKYHFESQEQASQYAGVMFALRDSLDEQPIVRQLLGMHNEQYPHKKTPQRKLGEARRLQRVSISEDDKVTLEYSGERFDPNLGKLSEASDAEVERGMPAWAVEVNRREEGFALASMRSALSSVDKKTDR